MKCWRCEKNFYKGGGYYEMQQGVMKGSLLNYCPKCWKAKESVVGEDTVGFHKR